MREICKDCEFSKKTLFGLKCTCESKMKVDPVTGKKKIRYCRTIREEMFSCFNFKER